MWHALHLDASLPPRLLELDRAIAAETRERGCWACGGPLHRADYPRRPRGVPELAGVDWERRFSFCCSVEGCRRRSTPGSVRFLGRRVYAAVVVTLVSAVAQGLSGRRLARLRAEVGVPRRTLERWLSWWREDFARTRLWRGARGAFAEPVDAATLPRSLLERFAGDERERLVACLRFLAPLGRSVRMEASSAMAG